METSELELHQKTPFCPFIHILDRHKCHKVSVRLVVSDESSPSFAVFLKPRCRRQVSLFSSRLSRSGPAAASATERPPSCQTPLSTVSPHWQRALPALPLMSAVSPGAIHRPPLTIIHTQTSHVVETSSLGACIWCILLKSLQLSPFFLAIESVCVCVFRCGSPACSNQPPVFLGQRGGCVRAGGGLHLDELQTAWHDRRGGHGTTSGGEWVHCLSVL